MSVPGDGYKMESSWDSYPRPSPTWFFSLTSLRPKDSPLTRAAIVNELGAEVGLRCKYVYCDVTKWESQVSEVQAALAASPLCVLDVVITFAGVCVQPGGLLDLIQVAGEPTRRPAPPPPDTANIDVNLTGTYYTSWLAMYYLRLEGEPNPSVPSGDCIPSRDKALILVSSMVVYMDAPIAPSYTASKTGVRGLFRSIRPLPVDLRSKGSTHISCSLLAPWFVDTSFLDPMRAIVGREALDKHSSGYTSMDSIVTAASYCATNPDVHGKAFAVMPEGIYDLQDNYEHGWAGAQSQAIIAKRIKAGHEVAAAEQPLL